jgi:DNA polymerase bacteriophage-type
MPELHLDFETRSKIDLPKSGPWRYAEDESTEILCMAYKIDKQPTQLWVPDIMGTPQDLLDAIAAGYTIKAHNVFFEKSIWYNICHKKYG